MMTNEALTEFIKNLVPEAEFSENTQFLLATVPSTSTRKLMEALRNDASTSFDYMFCLSGVDYTEYLQVVYHLKSTEHGHQVVIHATISDRENPEIETMSDIWRTAEFHEREAYDFYGIRFLDHPDLRRIFLDDEWVGWPMRKDYVDPVNMIEY